MSTFALASTSPLGFFIQKINDERKRRSNFTNVETKKYDKPVEEEEMDVPYNMLIIFFVIMIIILIIMCVCWNNILPDGFMKPLHIILFIFVTGLYMFFFLLYVGLINKHKLVAVTRRSPSMK